MKEKGFHTVSVYRMQNSLDNGNSYDYEVKLSHDNF